MPRAGKECGNNFIDIFWLYLMLADAARIEATVFTEDPNIIIHDEIASRATFNTGLFITCHTFNADTYSRGLWASGGSIAWRPQST
jgi:hypothetical protein